MGIFYLWYVLWVNCALPLNSCVEVLIPCTSECDYLERGPLARKLM